MVDRLVVPQSQDHLKCRERRHESACRRSMESFSFQSRQAMMLRTDAIRSISDGVSRAFLFRTIANVVVMPHR